jgi:hypothetical protein
MDAVSALQGRKKSRENMQKRSLNGDRNLPANAPGELPDIRLSANVTTP